MISRFFFDLLFLILYSIYGYYLFFYLITDPSDQGYAKVSLAYSILCLGFIHVSKNLLRIFHYIFMGVVFIAFTLASIKILELG